MTNPPAEHVRAAFGVASAEPELLAGGQGTTWRCGDTVLKPAASTAEAAWIASTFEQLQIAGIRLARPVRSSDGRWVVGGWTAQRFVAGRPEDRYEEVLQAADRLHSALAGVPQPRFLADRDDLYSWADRLAWGEIEDVQGRLGDGHGANLFAELAAGRRPVTATAQVVHGDMFGNVLFAASAPPAVVDVTPYWRPPEWAAAVIVVDAISWGGATTDLVQENAERPDWPEMLRRALLFRLGVSLAHPRSTAESLVEILSAAEVLQDQLAS
ncbi:TIGR02569 family protein [Nakamurella lactea]|uniref:TIGR02569 family protein n=1 Tax=Nakamurella lactea TaxID=459515 RepID=UPI000A038894|nr:TIGR02569 family protein [Nakamurella lactea]